MKKFGDTTLTKQSNLLPMIKKTGIVWPHDITHVLPKIFSLSQSLLEKLWQIHIWGNSQRLKETEEDQTAKGNEGMVFDWILFWGEVWAGGSYKEELRKFEFRLYSI